ncbi:glucosaminidase domain-containing protein [Modicisalibacter coralii]|uniref:glucosaminidase domain-containing protein n=1 Tax=Modicisalibacter coralii TaxID=2304602 RepID=UPI00100A4E2F|nr:glucosaminidase domain-containing protein [Halomonas coralii]
MAAPSETSLSPGSAAAFEETLITELPDLRSYPAGPARKQAFLELVVPIVEAENARIAEQRAFLAGLEAQGGPQGESQRAALNDLCRAYDVECRGKPDATLLTRVAPVPVALVVVQAVEESGWGTSRFARQGNNLFGMRCFSADCGLEQRGSGRGYQVFASVQDAVRSYLRNLNTHQAYAGLRQLRARLIAKGREVTAESLVGALEGYATRHDYQDVLLGLLRSNDSLIERHRRDDTV